MQIYNDVSKPNFKDKDAEATQRKPIGTAHDTRLRPDHEKL